jgi:hypothetical protein
VAGIALELALRHEYAIGSSRGFVAMGWLFTIPMLFCFVAGAICLLASGVVFLHHLRTSKKSA